MFTAVTFALNIVSIAFLISGFVAFSSTTKTSLFSASMRRIAFSVAIGCFIILHEEFFFVQLL